MNIILIGFMGAGKTTVGKRLAEKMGYSFLDTDDRNTRTCVTKTGLKGTYDIRVIIEDKKYETGIQITC